MILSVHIYFCFDSKRKEKERSSELELSKKSENIGNDGSFVVEPGLIDYREQPGEEVEGEIDYVRPEGLLGEPTDPIFGRPGSTNRGDDGYPIFEDDDQEVPGQPRQGLDSLDLAPSLPREIKASEKKMASGSKGRSINLDFSSEEDGSVLSSRGLSIKL